MKKNKLREIIRWIPVVMLLVVVGVWAATGCVAPGYNPDAGASTETIREQVTVLEFGDAVCYVYNGYGISCVSK